MYKEKIDFPKYHFKGLPFSNILGFYLNFKISQIFKYSKICQYANAR